jgi:hypothetical protein
MPVKPGLPEKSQRISVVCACGKKLVVGVKHAGRRAKCPACGEPIVIPSVPVRVAPAPTRAKSKPQVQAGNRRLVIAVGSLPILVVIGAALVIHFAGQSSEQARIAEANTAVNEAVHPPVPEAPSAGVAEPNQQAEQQLGQADAMSVAATEQEKSAESLAIKEIKRLGGRIERDDKLPGHPIKGISFKSGRRFEDKDVRMLKGLKHLTELDLALTKITDHGLKELGQLKNLTKLNLAWAKITDEGLKEVSQLENLAQLNLALTNITDEGLQELGRLKNLTELDLRGTKITDKGLQELRTALPNARIVQPQS